MTDVSRRTMLSTGTAALAASVLGAKVARSATLERPNILWLVSEDNNPLIGAYGDKLARTPTLDRLAGEGILYENVYSNAPVCAPSRFGIITGVHPESAGPAHNMRAIAQLPSRIGGFPLLLRDVGYYCTNSAKTDYNSNLKPDAVWNASGATAHWRDRPEGAPFFAVFNFMTTHEFQIFKPLEGSVKPDQVRVPAYLPDTPGVRRDIATYYNRIEAMDGEIAAKLAELDAAGLSDNTIIFYYSDNGGALPRSKRYCYDEGHRCAMIVRVPPKWRHLAPVAPVSYIDLAPTILSLAGITAPAHMQGAAFLGRSISRPKRFAFGMRNRMDERYDMARTVTDGRYRYIRNYSPHRIWGQRGAYQWQAQAYQDWESAHIAGTLNPVQEQFWTPKPFEQFFDLETDRDQVNNLIEASEHAARISEMREALDAHMLRVNDNGFIPEGSALEGYEESRKPGAYPLQRIMALAAAAGRRDARNLPFFVDALSDTNEVIRYWGAQGLLILGEAARPALPELQRTLSSDPSPQVQIAAAEAAANLSEDPAPVALLADLLDRHPHPRVKLQAINALTYIGEKARPARAAIARATEINEEYVPQAARYLGLVLDGTYTPAARLSTFGQPRPPQTGVQ